MLTLRPVPCAARCLACLAAFFSLCCAALAGEPEIAVAVEKSGEVFIVDARLDVSVPLRTAWEVLTDFDGMAAILSNVAASRITRRSGNTLYVTQEGKATYGLFTYTFASEREIRIEPMKRIVARQLSGTAKRFESETALVPTAGGTEVRYHAEIVPGSVIARALGGPFIEHEVTEQLGAMAAAMLRRKAP